MRRAVPLEPQYAHVGPCIRSSQARVSTYALRVVGCDVSSLCADGPPLPPPRRRRDFRPPDFFLAGRAELLRAPAFPRAGFRPSWYGESLDTTPIGSRRPERGETEGPD